ncbi:MAG: putative rane protein [Phenylobacterium sp.]|nr:putative rane protein [Phenylobacterium sp.]
MSSTRPEAQGSQTATQETSDKRLDLRFALTVVLLAAALLWPAVWNRSPILFFDSVGYFGSGEAAIKSVDRFIASHTQSRTEAVVAPATAFKIDARGNGVSTERSVYYGLLMVALFKLGGAWLTAATQCLIASFTLLLALRRLGIGAWRSQAVIAAAIALPSGLAVFSSAIMPDVYLGLMLLSMSVLYAHFDVMRPWERLWFIGIVLAAVLFHKAHLAVAAGLICVASLLLMGLRRKWLPVTASLLAVVVVAVGAYAAVDMAVQRVTGKPAIQFPFLLARVIGDGTAAPYLDRHCRTQPFVTCRFRSRMPMTENTFLWSADPARGAFYLSSAADRAQISQEQKTIVVGAVVEDPIAQVLASARNTALQLFTVGATEFQRHPGRASDQRSGFAPALEAYQHSKIAENDMPLKPLSTVMLWVYLFALAAIGVLAVMQFRDARRGFPSSLDPQDRTRFWIAAVVAAAGLIINAAVSGILAGVFDRYQGRAAWLALLFAMAAALMIAKDRRGGHEGGV